MGAAGGPEDEGEHLEGPVGEDVDVRTKAMELLLDLGRSEAPGWAEHLQRVVLVLLEESPCLLEVMGCLQAGEGRCEKLRAFGWRWRL